MLTSKKHVFWQAFFLTVLFFLLGLSAGIYMEQLRSDKINLAFYNSEASLYDSFALGQLLKDSTASCGVLKSSSITFADKIYAEARELEKFDQSNQLTESTKIIHRKYDLLRTLLWMNVVDLKKRCEVNTVVYLYTYDTTEIRVKSKQVVWSRILSDLKTDQADKFILIPLAADQNITSLDYLVQKYNIKQFPAVIINEKDVFYENEPAQKLAIYLK